MTISGKRQLVCYRVYAVVNSATSDPSNVACTAQPNRPSDLVAQSLDAESITIKWRDHSAVEDGYEVLRKRPRRSVCPDRDGTTEHHELPRHERQPDCALLTTCTAGRSRALDRSRPGMKLLDPRLSARVRPPH